MFDGIGGLIARIVMSRRNNPQIASAKRDCLGHQARFKISFGYPIQIR